MKKTLLLSFITTSIIFAFENPLSIAVKNIENGGPLTEIDSYQDGIGAMVEGYKVNNSAMNQLVYKYGQEAADNNIDLVSQVLSDSTATDEDKLLAKDILNSRLDVEDGTKCDDGNPDTIDDTYIANECIGICDDGNELTVGNLVNGECVFKETSCENGLNLNPIETSVLCANSNLSSLTYDWINLTTITRNDSELSIIDLSGNNLTNVDELINLTEIIQGNTNSTNGAALLLNNNPNLQNVNGLANLGIVYGGRYGAGIIDLRNNPSLTDISGLKNVDLYEYQNRGKIYFDDRNYDVKLPENSLICTTNRTNFIETFKFCENGIYSSCENGFSKDIVSQDITCNETNLHNGVFNEINGWAPNWKLKSAYSINLNNSNLTNLYGLRNLTTITRNDSELSVIDLSGNNLTNVDELINLTEISQGNTSARNGVALLLNNNPNLQNVNGLANLGRVYGGRYGYGTIDLRNNPSLTDISGLENVDLYAYQDRGKIYFDDRNYDVKLSASSLICSTNRFNGVSDKSFVCNP